MTARHAFDQPVETQTTEMVRHVASAIVVERATEELRDRRPDIAMPKPARVKGEETQRLHEGEDSAVAEAQRGGALGVDDDRVGQAVQVIVTNQTVVAEIFDAQEASVGGKANLPQGGQIAERTTGLEVIGIVDGRFGAKGLAFFVVCLTLAFLSCTWREGTTPSVRTRVRKLPGVRRETRRLKIGCI